MTHPGPILRAALWVSLAAFVSAGCDDDDDSSGGEGAEGAEQSPPEQAPREPEAPQESAADAADAVADTLPNGLLLSYAQFEVEDGKVTPKPKAARLELLYRRNGEWKTTTIEDPDSNVFHKAMVYEPPNAAPGILTLGGDAAALKLWRSEGDGFEAETLWKEDFGGKHSRMRDAEVADLYGDGKLDIALATHDQGVVAVVRPEDDGGWKVERLHQQKDTFIHEIEIGDLDGDGVLEFYATPSDPNKLEGGETQRGKVMRFVPKKGENAGVAELGDRHAKEIYVDDVDGDGKDELYVAVEARTEKKQGGGVEVVEPVEILRYDADTAPDEGVRIATIDDRLTRFLTAGDVNGDGDKELVAAAFRSGLWLLEPGSNPRSEWGIQNIDRNSSGFEHASFITDLDDDGQAELYVAADDQGELRRYVWRNHQPQRTTIHSRQHASSMLTWNIMPFPVSLLDAAEGSAGAKKAEK